jgi:hypothetical protein
MSYDNPQREVYVIPSTAFGAANESLKFIGPAGKTGLVRDIMVEPTADMVGTTTGPEINDGASANASEYARFRLGTTAILGYTAAAGPRRAKSLVGGPANTGGVPPTLADFASHVLLETARIPADTAFFISGTAGVGGTPAGTARREVIIDWF